MSFHSSLGNIESWKNVCDLDGGFPLLTKVTEKPYFARGSRFSTRCCQGRCSRFKGGNSLEVFYLPEIQTDNRTLRNMQIATHLAQIYAWDSVPEERFASVPEPCRPSRLTASVIVQHMAYSLRSSVGEVSIPGAAFLPVSNVL